MSTKGLVTIKEARERWKKHTKKVLNCCARESFKKGEIWDDEPAVRSKDGKYAVYFLRDNRGHVYGTTDRAFGAF